MTGIPLTEEITPSVPLAVGVLAKYDRVVDGSDNPYVRRVLTGEATPQHWNQLLYYLDTCISSQITDYRAGILRFPAASVAWPFMDFATYKLSARAQLRAASDAIETRYPSAVLADVPSAAALYYGCCSLWASSVASKAATSLAMYAGLLDWYRFCTELLDALVETESEPSGEFLKVLRRVQNCPDPLDHRLVLVAHGLAVGDPVDEGIRAMDISFVSTAAFFEACAR